jgi:glycosyltransferase involved in cell wall biosynthesis
MRIAFIHDWLNGMRGGERCLDALGEIYPEAHLYTLFHERGQLSPTIEQKPITTSFIQKLPFVFKKYRHYLPLFPVAIEQFDLREYDVVVSLSHCVANGVITRPQTCHIGYTFTPMRYAWDLYFDYFGRGRLRGLSRIFIPIFMNYLRMWDVAASARVDYFVAISNHIRQRIEKHYRRSADVIYPPVDTEFYTPDSQTPREDFLLVAGAFAPYKRVDLAIEICNRLQRPLTIVGKGQEAERLKKLAGPTIEIVDAPTNEILRDYYRRCQALLYPGEEDFGIMPIEAQACGTPVIAYARGGALETTIQDVTAIWFNAQTPEALMSAVQRFDTHSFDPAAIRKHACRFNRQRFQNEMRAYIEQKIAEFAS